MMPVIKQLDYPARATSEELVLKLLEFPQVECETLETWDKETKTYTREIFVPKGTMLVGFKHKRGCINVLAKGTMHVKNSIEDPGVVIEVPNDKTYTFITEPGTQKIGYAIEDSVFLNIFSEVPTDCTYEELMNTLVYPNSAKDTRLQLQEQDKLSGGQTWHS